MGTGSIRVLGRLYRVLLRKRMPTDGLCDYNSATIKVAATLDSYERKDALLHEVMHAILYQQGREYGGEVEETYVRALATGLVGVLQDNPRFAMWLASPIEERTR